MKKLFTLLLLLLPMALLSGCDDNDMPDVSINVKIEGVTRVDNTLYVVKGDTIDITGIELVDHTTKGAVIGSVVYYWDYYRIGSSVVPPYAAQIDTEAVSTGNHILQIAMSIFAVDYSACDGMVNYKVVVVNDKADIPSVGDVESNPTVNALIHNSKK